MVCITQMIVADFSPIKKMFNLDSFAFSYHTNKHGHVRVATYQNVSVSFFPVFSTVALLYTGISLYSVPMCCVLFIRVSAGWLVEIVCV